MILLRDACARVRKGKFHPCGVLWRMFLPVRHAVRGAGHVGKLARFGGPVGGLAYCYSASAIDGSRSFSRVCVKVACVGGGPAGLYLSILLKWQGPSHDVTVYERDPEGSTYGWGVTYWRGLLDRLHEQDPESAALLDAGSVRWSEGVAHVRDLTTGTAATRGTASAATGCWRSSPPGPASSAYAWSTSARSPSATCPPVST